MSFSSSPNELPSEDVSSHSSSSSSSSDSDIIQREPQKQISYSDCFNSNINSLLLSQLSTNNTTLNILSSNLDKTSYWPQPLTHFVPGPPRPLKYMNKNLHDHESDDDFHVYKNNQDVLCDIVESDVLNDSIDPLETEINHLNNELSNQDVTRISSVIKSVLLNSSKLYKSGKIKDRIDCQVVLNAIKLSGVDQLVLENVRARVESLFVDHTRGYDFSNDDL